VLAVVTLLEYRPSASYKQPNFCSTALQSYPAGYQICLAGYRCLYKTSSGYDSLPDAG
jgi:hypothetical protein